MAQSLFQVGGKRGIGDGATAGGFHFAARGNAALAWFSFVALLGILLLADIGTWTKRRRVRAGEIAGCAAAVGWPRCGRR